MSNLGNKGFIVSFSLQDHEEEKSGQELWAGTWRLGSQVAYWPLPSGLLSLVSYAPQDHLLTGSSTLPLSQLALPQQTSAKKNASQASLQVSVVEPFPVKSLLSTIRKRTG